ncbi:MAG: coproporphyrinogen dehydrogenase HemZ [Oscillibacter sp.]
MKLALIGHGEIYVVEQTLLTLFPEERLSYEPVSPETDARWAIISLEEEANHCRVTTEFGWDGKAAPFTQGVPLSGTDYEKEGQRRRCIGMSIFQAARIVTGIQPPWGSLTGVRPDKIAVEALENGASPAAARELLERTYFVTPDRAKLAVETAGMTCKTRKTLGAQDIALYVGIPFCPTRCSYCSFVSSSVARSFAQVAPYVDALTAEIEAGGRMARDQDLRVRAFYMGGGTPTTLTAPQMDRVLTALERAFDLTDCQEITVEAGRPDTVTREKLAVLKAHGVDRVSINPQSMEDSVLKAIGRCHSAADIAAAMDLVGEVGFAHVNMDLIAGLPEDTAEGFRRTLDACLQFGTDNLTVHTLSLKKGSRITLEGLRIPAAEVVGEMLDYAAPQLRGAGYGPYYLYRQKYMSGSFENVGWCKPGGECLYNIEIMSELCSILSFGAGGSTKMVVPGTNHIQRTFNLKYPKEYMERPEKYLANQAAFAAFYKELKGTR